MADITAIPEALRNSRVLILRAGSKQPAQQHATMEHGAAWTPAADEYLARGNGERLGIFMAGRYVVLDADLKQAWEDDGTGAQVFVVTRNGNDDVLRLMADAGLEELPRTVKIRTQGGGTHWYFEQNSECRVTQRRIGYLDVRAAPNAYCAIGAGYELLDDGGGKLAVLPLELARAIMATRHAPAEYNGDAAQNGSALATRDAAYGDKETAFNNWLTQLKGALVRGGCTNDEANEAVWRLNEVSREPLTREEFDGTVGRDKGWVQGTVISEDEWQWAMRQTGIEFGDPDEQHLDVPTVKRLVTTERWKRQRLVDEAMDQLERLEIMTGADAANEEPLPWLLPDILPQGPSTGAIIGGKGSYKTTISLIFGAAIARGGAVMGRPARKGPVVFLAGEAWEYTTRMIPKIRGAEQMLFTKGRFGLSVETAPVLCKRLLDKLPEPPVMVVFDTLSRFHNGDENKPTEMLAVWDGAAAVADELGALVFLIAHTGHAGEHVRGASSWGQALDTEIFTDGSILKFNKQRGIPQPADIPIRYTFLDNAILVDEGIDFERSRTNIENRLETSWLVLEQNQGCSATDAAGLIMEVLHTSKQDASQVMRQLENRKMIERSGSGGRAGYQISTTDRNEWLDS